MSIDVGNKALDPTLILLELDKNTCRSKSWEALTLLRTF